MEKETMWHYSTETGKPEKCTATHQKDCPYGNHYHTTNYEWAQVYANRQNEASHQAKANVEHLINTDWTYESFVPALYSWSNEADYKVTIEGMKKAGFPFDESELKGKDYILLPKHKDAVHSLLCVPGMPEEIMETVNNKIPTDTTVDRQNVSLYDKWKFLMLATHAGDSSKNVMNAEVYSGGPAGPAMYSFADVWKDYLTYKKQSFQIQVKEVNGQQFQLIVIDSFTTRKKK